MKNEVATVINFLPWHKAVGLDVFRGEVLQAGRPVWAENHLPNNEHDAQRN